MSDGVSEPFIRRPVATTLLMVGLLLVGLAAFTQLPVSALPQVDYPTIVVSTYLPGGSAETMSSAVTTPLERQFGQMPSLTQMTSVSSFGYSQVTLQFDLDRSIDAAQQDVQAAIKAVKAGQGVVNPDGTLTAGPAVLLPGACLRPGCRGGDFGTRAQQSLVCHEPS